MRAPDFSIPNRRSLVLDLCDMAHLKYVDLLEDETFDDFLLDPNRSAEEIPILEAACDLTKGLINGKEPQIGGLADERV